MEWQWRNDAEGLPDDDNRRCITARGERLLVYAGQPFGLATLPCSRVPEPASGSTAEPCALHEMEYRGLGRVYALTGAAAKDSCHVCSPGPGDAWS